MQSLVPGGRIFTGSIDEFRLFTLANYYDVVFEPYRLDIIFLIRNSLIIAGASALSATLLGSVAAYAFARFRFRGDNDAKLWILSFKFFPPIVIVLPLFLLFTQSHLYDTYQGMILVYGSFNLPFSVWLMASFIEDIPMELEESAFIDGCNRFQVFSRILIPLLRGGLVTAGLFNFIFAWNEFLFALCLTGNNVMPLTVGLAAFAGISGIHWGYLASASIFMLLPIIVTSAVLQRYIVRGLTFGALKE
jgi:multiple sugar transport system permease protein